jgi:hypothetical protein
MLFPKHNAYSDAHIYICAPIAHGR